MKTEYERLAESSFKEASMLDKKLPQGCALLDYYDEESLYHIKRTVYEAFGAARNDTSREFGACIAHGVNVPSDVEEELDELILNIAEEQNHGMVTIHALSEGGEHTLWEGHDKNANKTFVLAKHVIDLSEAEDDNARTRLVYTLGAAQAASQDPHVDEVVLSHTADLEMAEFSAEDIFNAQEAGCLDSIKVSDLPIRVSIPAEYRNGKSFDYGAELMGVMTSYFQRKVKYVFIEDPSDETLTDVIVHKKLEEQA